MVQSQFWNRKKVFLTGHTGFKGGWLSTWLLDMGAQVMGYALKSETVPSFFAVCSLDRHLQSVIGDVREKDALSHAMRAQQPDVVFHLAAQPIVRRSYLDPIETFATNVMGTVHLLDAVRRMPSVRAVIVVTSDKCYENREWVWGYREEDPMGGHDPYSASKGCAELVAAAYRRSFFRNVKQPLATATVRAGNVIGGGDWAEDRVMPDAIRALQRNEPLVIRNPRAVRPWQHVLEPIAGYLMLAERLYQEGWEWSGAWNFGPGDEDVRTVASLADLIFQMAGEGSWQSVQGEAALHESKNLKLDCSKARQLLGWRPLLTLEKAVEMTLVWYRKALSGAQAQEMYEMTCKQIRTFVAQWRTAEGR